MFTTALVLVLAPLAAAQAPPLTSAQAAAVDAAARGVLEADGLVGLAVGVVRGGAVVYTRGYGFANREAEVPVSAADTLFRWASCSKPLTAVAALLLAEQGRLDLDADVRTLVPEFPDPGAVVTTRQLLCHQGGVVHYMNGKVVKTRRTYDVPQPFADVVLALDHFAESPLVNKPGEKFSYTTHGYILLSAVVQRAGGQQFAGQVRDRIARPLGMTTLRPDYQWEFIPCRAVGYRKRSGEVTRSDDTDVSWKLGGGGFLSSVDDFARFAAGLANRRLVSATTEALMWAPQPLADGRPTTYGLGFQVDTADGKFVVGHGGAQEKTRTWMMIQPREKRAVVVMTNSEWANPRKVAEAVAKALE